MLLSKPKSSTTHKVVAALSLYLAILQRCYKRVTSLLQGIVRCLTEAVSPSMKRHLHGGATGISLQPHQILRLPRKGKMSWLIRITYETSFTMHGATGITLQPHQILRLPRKRNVMIDPHHIWNVIYNARSDRHHSATSPNTAPATQNYTPKS